MNRLFIFLLCAIFNISATAKPKDRYIRIKTAQGICIVRLYNETPLHRKNFIRLTRKKVFDGTLFHRVIEGFMIQGGDPDSKNAKPGAQLGEGSVGYTVPAEFRDSLFHKKGALAAARDNNPQKASSGSQFYLVQGKTFTDEELDLLEQNRLHFKIPAWQRAVYKTIGGTPHLDRNYTVFGEVVLGTEMIDSIASIEKDNNDRPLKDIKMTVSLLKHREIKELKKQLHP